MDIIRSFAVILILAVPVVCVAGPAEDAEAALKNGGDSVVENLVDIGRVSPDAAAAVFAVTARNRPIVLRASMEGLAGSVTASAYGRAVSLAAGQLSGEPELRHLVLDIAREILLPGTRPGPGPGQGGPPPGRIGEDPLDIDEPASPS